MLGLVEDVAGCLERRNLQDISLDAGLSQRFLEEEGFDA
jgi:hypothetical protein